MKLITLFLIFTCVVVSQQSQKFEDVVKTWIANFELHKKDCVAESNVETTLAERMVTFGEFVDNPALKCYAKCVVVKLNAINEVGELVPDVFRQLLGVDDAAVVDKVVNKCGKIKGTDLCDTIFSMSKCVFPAIQEALQAS